MESDHEKEGIVGAGSGKTIGESAECAKKLKGEGCICIRLNPANINNVGGTCARREKSVDKGLPAGRARLYNLYCCDREKQKDPYCSPVYAPDEMLSGFPSARPARCGAETAIKRVPGAEHAFTVCRREGHKIAFKLIVRSLRKMLNLK